MKEKLIYIFGFGLIFLIVSLVNIFISEPIFNSPDEAANYQVVREYGKTGNMYLTGEYLDIDYGNNLHPRGFITHNEKLVPFNFLGIPLFYGTFYSYFGDNIRFINLIFLFIVTIFLYKITEVLGILNKKKFGLIFIGILGCLPLLYYLNFPYYNIVPFITFIIPFIYYILKFNKTGIIKYLYVGILFALISIWMRYEQVIFITLFMIINIFYNHKIYLLRNYTLLHIISIFILSIIVFLIPLLILNQILYGNPLTYGYSLFTSTFFAEERTGSISQTIINIFFPSQEFNLQILGINIKNNLFMVSPLFFLFGYLVIFKKNIIKNQGLYILLGIYLVFYTGMGETYRSGEDIISIHTSMGRYWLIIYTIFIVFSLIVLKKNFSYFAIITLFIIINMQLMFSELNYQKNILIKQNSINNNYRNLINYNSYIITPIEGKYFFDISKPISWWGNTHDINQSFIKNKYYVIDVTKKLLYNSKDIYANRNSNYFSRGYHFKFFEEAGIGFEHIEGNLYKLYLKPDYEAITN